MIDFSKLDETLISPNVQNKKFQPHLVNLEIPLMNDPKEIPIEDTNSVDIDPLNVKSFPIVSDLTSNKSVIAIDSTAMRLGTIDDGIIGVIRLSVIRRKAGERSHYLDKYGPKMVVITNQNRDDIYKNLFHKVYGKHLSGSLIPENLKVLDRVRNLYERYIQSEIVKSNEDSIILFDGSLIGGTVDNPKFFIEDILKNAKMNRNIVVSISKNTNLTLKHNKRSILSLIENNSNSIFLGPINNKIEQNSERYLGDIHVCRLIENGHPFRIDIPKDSAIESNELFGLLSALSGPYGYPEELKFAHSTCVHSSIEILALQALAIHEHKMQIEENLRNMIFAPFITG